MRELNKRGQEEPWNMHHTSFDHPPVEVLERLVLRHCTPDETEIIETHMLACESCQSALENLEFDIAAMKLVLADHARQTELRPAALQQPKWRSWFTVPVLSWAGASLAACAFCLVAFVPVNVNLAAERGIEQTSVAPEWRRVNLNLEGASLPAGKLRAEIVSETGAHVWSGEADNLDGRVHVRGLRMTQTGHFLARVYSSASGTDLLAEYPFEVKFEF